MSKVFGTIAALLLAAAAFVAYKNQQALAVEAGNSKTGTDGRLQIEEKKKKSNTDDFNAEVAKYKQNDEERAGFLDEADKAAKELETATAQYNEQKKKVDALEAQSKANETEIAQAEEDLKGLPDPEVLIPKIKRMSADLAKTTTESATEDARLANLTQQDKDGKKRIKIMQDIMRDYASGKSLAHMKTRISSVYANWGFVILAAGDKQGVVTDSTLDVLRGGEKIGKLRVTAVEAGRSSADIVLDSVAEGTVLQVGDTVVPEKKEEAAPAAAAVAAPKR